MKIITHPNNKEKHRDKYGLYINNIGTQFLAKSLSLGAQAIWHTKDSIIKADLENLINLNENDSLIPICQFLEHQIVDSDYTLSGLFGAATQNIETPNKYSVDIKFRSSHQRFFMEKSVLRNVAKFIGKYLCHVFSCECCEISENTIFTEHLWAIACSSCS